MAHLWLSNSAGIQNKLDTISFFNLQILSFVFKVKSVTKLYDRNTDHTELTVYIILIACDLVLFKITNLIIEWINYVFYIDCLYVHFRCSASFA